MKNPPTDPADPYYQILSHPHRVTVGYKVELDAEQIDVLRDREVNVKEAFTIRGPEGNYFRASLQSAGQKGGEAMVYEEMPRSPESPLHLTLITAVLSRQRMLLVCQKAAELGVSVIQPVFSEHSVGPDGLEHEKHHAWPGAVLRAVRQCRRASVPFVAPVIPLREALELDWWIQSARVVLDTEGGGPPPWITWPQRVPAVALAVGPEGGWSGEERQLLSATTSSTVNLGSRVVRAETAVLVGLTLLQHRWGDLAYSAPPPAAAPGGPSRGGSGAGGGARRSEGRGPAPRYGSSPRDRGSAPPRGGAWRRGSGD